VDGVEHLLVLLRPGDGEHLGMRPGDVVGLRAEAPGDDHPAVLLDRLADGLEAFGLGAVEEPAGVHDHRLGALVVGRDRVALGPEPREDALAVHQRLRAAERDHADGRLAGTARVGHLRAGEVGAEIGRVRGHGARYSGAGEGREGGAGLSLINARRNRSKKGADRGIDGNICFARTSRAIVSVKAGDDVGVAMIRDLVGTIQREGAEIGVFLTLTEPTAPMRTEAAAAGLYEEEGFAPVPRVQIVTIAEALGLRDRAVRLPARRDDAFRKAAREEDRGAQGRSISESPRRNHPYAFHTEAIRFPYGENRPQRRRSRRLDIGWKATPTCASQ
jgi:hypothetical protein